MGDKARERKRVSTDRSVRPKVRKWTREMVGKLTRNDIARLSPADSAALLTMGEECRDCRTEIGRARQRIDAYNRCAADLFLQIDKLPRGHPERAAAFAKIRAMRPRALQAMDDLLYLEIKYALQLDETPIDNMPRA